MKLSIFNVLEMILPAWQYNLAPPKLVQDYWVNFDRLKPEDRALIEEPSCYSCREVALLDMAFQAWQKGLIAKNGEALQINAVRPNSRDEYRFARRYFNPVWSLFGLCVRLAEFHNPVSETAAFLSSFRAKRIDPYNKTKDWKSKLDGFHSELLERQPRVSVIIPTLNRYLYLKDALADLESQVYRNFEVLVVDQSDPFRDDFYSSVALNLKVIRQEEKALWLARNTAIAKSEGEFVLLYDDDSRVGPDWISSHIRCIDFFDADISSGVSISAAGARVPETYSYYKWSDQIDTGNVMLRKQVFREIGLFDRQFEKQRQGDGEFGLRAYLAGHSNISNPDAVRIHLKAGDGGLREMGSWDGWRPTNFLAPRPVPSVLYLTRKYFGNRAAVYQILQSVLPSFVPYRFKGNKIMMAVGSVLAILLSPLIFVSVVRSWRLATTKLQEGASIPSLD